jgi:hypothetical protein
LLGQNTVRRLKCTFALAPTRVRKTAGSTRVQVQFDFVALAGGARKKVSRPGPTRTCFASDFFSSCERAVVIELEKVEKKLFLIGKRS